MSPAQSALIFLPLFNRFFLETSLWYYTSGSSVPIIHRPAPNPPPSSFLFFPDAERDPAAAPGERPAAQGGLAQEDPGLAGRRGHQGERREKGPLTREGSSYLHKILVIFGGKKIGLVDSEKKSKIYSGL